MITKSDAVKLRLLTKKPVSAPKRLRLRHGDVAYTKSFLDDLATWSNDRVAKRLSDVLTAIRQGDAGLFDAVEMASRLAAAFKVPITVDGQHAV